MQSGRPKPAARHLLTYHTETEFSTRVALATVEARTGAEPEAMLEEKTHLFEVGMLERQDDAITPLRGCQEKRANWKGDGILQVKCIFRGSGEGSPSGMYGVAFLLNTDMTRAWKKAGEYTDFRGPRHLKIRLQIEGRHFSLLSCTRPRSDAWKLKRKPSTTH